MQTEQPDQRGSGRDGVTRRAFVGTTLAGGAALLTGGFTSLFYTSTAAGAFLGIEKTIKETTIPELKARVASGSITSQHLTANSPSRPPAPTPRLHPLTTPHPA